MNTEPTRLLSPSRISTLVETLERDGIVQVPGLVDAEALAAMQRAFGAAVRHPSWNTWRGHEQTDRFRRMVEDILLLDPAFQALGLDPLVREVAAAYIGPRFTLTEVRSWETVATRRSFHGWHNDAWYDHDLEEVPRELKLALYLTDVETGHFSYIKGTHHDTRHRHWRDREVAHLEDRIVHMQAPAGSTFLFDTAGVHRQSSPCLAPRWVVMYNYHDPALPLQEIDVRQYRYAPLHLNAAFLGGLGEEEQRVLGFGNRSTWRRGFRPPRRFATTHDAIARWLRARLVVEDGLQTVREVVDGVRRRLGGRRG
ncbi:MAG: phytanoyl-CoA dioxygenase family protein [Candidatus Eiseniibacteriota bacterium]